VTPIALTIAGSDPSGGAGIQADLKAFSANGAYGAAVLTALTVQNTCGVSGIFGVPAEFVRQQIDSVLEDLDVDVVKTGMLGSPEVVAAVAAAVRDHNVRMLVVDPVMVATSGDALAAAGTVEAVRELLLPLATLVTPNLPEAAQLLGCASLQEAEVEAAASALRGLGAQAALVKGGHGTGPTSTDVLADDRGVERWAAERVPTQNTHGTGCTLASAIAAHLARRMDLRAAVGEAKEYLTDSLRHADELDVGHGHGPVHHFSAYWDARTGARTPR